MHFATAFETIADVIGDHPALVHGATRRTWTEYDERGACFANALRAAGLRPDSKFGLYLYNSNEYLEAQFGGLKMRAVPVNVNYRYLDEELRYLLDNADAEALVFHSSLADRVARVRERLPRLKLLVEVDDGGPHLDGAARYEDVIAAHVPMPRIARDESDLYMFYTGGTTGMPKGVMYAIGGFTEGFARLAYDLAGLAAPTDIAAMAPVVAQLARAGPLEVSIPCCPLMHGTGIWLGAMMPMFTGATIVTLTNRSFDAREMWSTASREHATSLVIVGDAFAKPMVRAWDDDLAAGVSHDVSPLRRIVSSGVMWTAEVKEALLARLGELTLIDAIGSTEGSIGISVTTKAVATPTARFSTNPATKVFTEDGRLVAPGSGDVGMVAAGGIVPIGYYKDAAKSERTFRVIDGVRYSFAGDWATVEADGSLTLLGRGSQCINTGGEKVFPEEVEEAVKRVEGVYDCLVVGVPDDKFGERVMAIASLVPGSPITGTDIVAACKAMLAGYKAPKNVVLVANVPRAPNGKADYKKAKEIALTAS